ncbi:MAG TPA: phosphatase PAP2 family protein [Thermoanaerobaculia bacterium]|nr:phosphatase PAP2 family protein [Thermoanaerobaculia bacterium]
MSIEDKSRYAAAGFIVLLVLSLFWPEPIVSINRLWLHQRLGVDELSFLGREAPSWDVVFWCIAGLFAIAVLQTAETSREEIREITRQLRSVRVVLPKRFAVAAAVTIVAIAATWLAADAALVAVAERVQSDRVEDFIRMLNRLGGGMNPPMIVLFFIIAGLAYRRRRWLQYGVAMALAGVAAGIFAQIVKLAIGRTRPELWVGPFHYARTAANSFPSGHTVAAFALGGVLIIASRNLALRVIALLLAIAVAAARVLAFRHWPSDVVASALLGLLAAWVASLSVAAARAYDSGEAAQDR